MMTRVVHLWNTIKFTTLMDRCAFRIAWGELVKYIEKNNASPQFLLRSGPKDVFS